jgi:hypothetical protein
MKQKADEKASIFLPTCLRLWLSRAENCLWPSPAQLFLVSGPVRTHDDHLCVWKWGLINERRSWSFWAGATFVAPVVWLGKLLLAFTNAVILGSGPCRTQDHIFVHSKITHMFRNILFMVSGWFISRSEVSTWWGGCLYDRVVCMSAPTAGDARWLGSGVE